MGQQLPIKICCRVRLQYPETLVEFGCVPTPRLGDDLEIVHSWNDSPKNRDELKEITTFTDVEVSINEKTPTAG